MESEVPEVKTQRVKYWEKLPISLLKGICLYMYANMQNLPTPNTGYYVQCYFHARLKMHIILIKKTYQYQMINIHNTIINHKSETQKYHWS
jgi:hypothetical protein